LVFESLLIVWSWRVAKNLLFVRFLLRHGVDFCFNFLEWDFLIDVLISCRSLFFSWRFHFIIIRSVFIIFFLFFFCGITRCFKTFIEIFFILGKLESRNIFARHDKIGISFFRWWIFDAFCLCPKTIIFKCLDVVDGEKFRCHNLNHFHVIWIQTIGESVVTLAVDKTLSLITIFCFLFSLDRINQPYNRPVVL